jgi:lactate dehydrogenase-like 2-hydroxyacid dehydrogenase
MTTRSENSKPKVFVTRIIPAAGLDKLKAACEVEIWPEDLPPSYETLTEKVRGIDGLLCLLTEKIDGPLMDAAGPQLKVISQMAVGYDNIDIPAAKERGIPVGNTPGVLTDATADLTMALLLASARRIVEGVEYIKTGQWQTWEPMGLVGADLRDSTLGIIGLGRIGTAVAERCAGFKMRILAHSPSATQEDAAKVNATLVDLETLLRESDFVSIHAPLNESTRHLIDSDALALMKSSAILVNTARGGLVDQTALYAALTSGEVSGAALDVTDPEPVPLDEPLLTLPNVIVVPHIGSASRLTRDLMASMAADNLLAGLRGESLPNVVT